MPTVKLAAALFLAMVCAYAPALAEPAIPGPATLTVTGQGMISRAPDRARIDASIVTNDPAATRALSDNNAHYNALLIKLTALGLSQNALKTTGLSTYFNARPAESSRADGARYGYVVTRSLQVTPATLASAGGVIDALTGAGATIGGIGYSLRDVRAAQREALTAAIVDAAQAAREMAAAAHVRIVRILRIGSEPALPRPYFAAGARMSAANASIPTEVPPENVDVQATVTLTYEIR
ncbi:MAG: SIMPL domain-containing protein [Candidatus Velthaea sp.]